MTRVIRSAAFLSAFLALAAPLAAQDALTQRVSLDLKAMAPAEAFKVIATAIGYTAEVAPDVTAPVDIVVRNITARSAMNTICESIGCAWRATGTVIRVRNDGAAVPGAGRLVVRQRRADERSARVTEFRRQWDQMLPPDMKFENAPLPQVAERLSKATGFDVTFSGDALQGQTFSGDLGNRPFSAALKTLAEQLHGSLICRVGLARDGKGGRISVAFRIAPARKSRK